MKTIAINGFGRIGKTFFRALLTNQEALKKLTVAAINLGPTNPEHLVSFIKYDSVFGTLDRSNISFDGKHLKINNHSIEIFTESDPSKLPWGSLGIDFVVEASGHFTSREKASAHLEAGAKKVLISAPATDEDVTIIPGVNDGSYDAEKHTIISLGSCTTNCFAPMVKVIQESFSFEQGFMTTTHAYTNNQAVLDSSHKDPRRGRAAAVNIIPTSTGADKVITKIYPELAGKLQGTALRVPVPLGSIVDFTFTTTEELSVEKINAAFTKAAKTNLQGILEYTDEPLVSTDIIGSPYSCIFDSKLTKAQKNMGKVFGWYDNEYGYSCRLKDFLLHN